MSSPYSSTPSLTWAGFLLSLCASNLRGTIYRAPTPLINVGSHACFDKGVRPYLFGLHRATMAAESACNARAGATIFLNQRWISREPGSAACVHVPHAT